MQDLTSDTDDRKIETLEREIDLLKSQMHNNTTPSQSFPVNVAPQFDPRLATCQQHQEPDNTSNNQISPTNMSSIDTSRGFQHVRRNTESTSPSTSFLPIGRPPKRKRSHFEVGTMVFPDLVTTGLLTYEQAKAYFDTFFSGCDRYVPIFDLKYDSIESVRSRSGLLFGTICAVGCRVLDGTDSQNWHLLSFHTQRMLNAAIATPGKSSIETIQALLVRACYVSERSLLVAVATRMAQELGLPEAYETLSARFVSVEEPLDATSPETAQDDDMALMHKSRTWLHILVLSHILHVDAGDLPTFRFRGDGSGGGVVRRCRILLDSPVSTGMDLYLFSQVELNALRARIYRVFSQDQGDDVDIMDSVRDAKLDFRVWFNDWKRLYEEHRPQMPWLTPNLRIQRCWSEAMALCRAVRASGVENVNAMSTTQRTILLMVKSILKEHLEIILEEPRIYLQSLRFAMDFVWAKNAFCFLLLLKLSMLLPDGDDEQTHRRLIEQGTILITELSNAGGGIASGGRSNTSSLYLRLIKMSIDKYSQTLLGETMPTTEFVEHGGDTNTASHLSVPNPRGMGGHNELESFVPEEFVFEWDFPGLTLFSSPTTDAGWLEDFLAGTFDNGEDFYGLGWTPMDLAG